METSPEIMDRIGFLMDCWCVQIQISAQSLKFIESDDDKQYMRADPFNGNLVSTNSRHDKHKMICMAYVSCNDQS